MTEVEASLEALKATLAELAELAEPACGKCGAPVTTGAMALLCPLKEQCEFWPEEGIDERFYRLFHHSE